MHVENLSQKQHYLVILTFDSLKSKKWPSLFVLSLGHSEINPLRQGACQMGAANWFPRL